MAPERGRRLVHGERDGAVRAVAYVAARGTLQVGGEPPAIQEQDHLLAPAEYDPVESSRLTDASARRVASDVVQALMAASDA